MKVIKLHHVMYILRGMGYDVDDARSVICIIDMFNLDKSQFDFPYDWNIMKNKKVPFYETMLLT